MCIVYSFLFAACGVRVEEAQLFGRLCAGVHWFQETLDVVRGYALSAKSIVDQMKERATVLAADAVVRTWSPQP